MNKERERDGKFARGNSGGPGRPKKSEQDRLTVEELRELMLPGDFSPRLAAMLMGPAEDTDEALADYPEKIQSRVRDAMELSRKARGLLVARLQAEIDELEGKHERRGDE